MIDYKLSVIIAIQHAQENLPLIFEKLSPANHKDVEFLFCLVDADKQAVENLVSLDNVRVVMSTDGNLIPHLWRDGIVAAQSEKVALGTAHCIPASDWVEQLLATDMQVLPGIGGVIENDKDSSAKDWAVYLLRYIPFSPPQTQREMHEIAADNAVYRRADILEQSDLLKKGFWEPSFHAEFRKKGLHLELHPNIRVTHRNRYSSTQFFAQRFFHGIEFGLARARNISTIKRFMLIVLSPLLPFIFLRKIISAVLKQGSYNSKLIIASPWLLFFLSGWGFGEACGYLLYSKRK